MDWRGFTINGEFKDLSHLNSFSMTTEIDGINIELIFTFLSHCFTDEKGGTKMPFTHEERYWSNERYHLSLALPKLIKDKFLSKYAIVFKSHKSAEQYHYMEAYDYAIFFNINKPKNTNNTLKIKIISAYEVEQWGKNTLPKGKPKRISWILSQRNKGLRAR